MTTQDDQFHSDTPEIGRSVSLPVIDSNHSQRDSGAPMMGRTRTGRWRAGVLILVNVLMIAHLIQWLIAGMTISPIEPSEAMETLEVGVVNAGAIFFLVAIISTIVFGRFFCGWACHVVALQDLCAYMMTSIGIRPKPFRSRLLVYFPFLLGMYMFVWPSFKRLALAPALESMSIDWPVFLKPVEPITHFSSALVVDDFWATMPPWFIAVPFLFICGFAAVYFLGAKGFCTYGCPYAAFFKPLDKVAPLRIRVDDNCHQCGYCTSACTSNVRVSEEVRDFGMVVDPGCMKTLDCISACPNDALSLGFGKVALFAKPTSPETYIQAKQKRARRFDMKLWEELFACVLFLWFFYATRGMLDAVPMLMAGGLAAIGVMIVIMTLKLVHESNVRLYKFQFKAKGKIKPTGLILILVALGFAVGSIWSGNARLMRWRGDIHYAASDLPSSVLMRTEFLPSPEQARQAKSAINAYKRGDSFAKGGMGWNLDAEHRLRLSYFLSVLGRYDESLEQLEQVIEHGQPTDQLVIQAGQLAIRSIDTNPPSDMDAAGIDALKRQRMLSIYSKALAAHPQLHAIRTELARSAFSMGNRQEAEQYFKTQEFDNDPMFFLAQAGFSAFTGDMVATKALYEHTSQLALSQDKPRGVLIDIGRAAIQFGMVDVVTQMSQLAVEDPTATALTWLAAGELANATGNAELGTQRALHALTMPGVDRPLVQARAAGVLAQPGNTDQSRTLLIDAASRSKEPFEIVYIAQGMVRGGASLGDTEMLNKGLEIFQEVAQDHPDLYVIRHDLASMLYSVGRSDEAIEQMTIAAELDEHNPVLASRVSELYQIMGNQEESARWQSEAQTRAQYAHQDQ